MHPVPIEMKPVDEKTLRIEWSDRVETLHAYRELRGNCPCAECVDEITGARRIFPKHISETIKPVEAVPVGRYAYQFNWSDGHNTGLFTYEYLRQLAAEPSNQ